MRSEKFDADERAWDSRVVYMTQKNTKRAELVRVLREVADSVELGEDDDEFGVTIFGSEFHEGSFDAGASIRIEVEYPV